MGDMGDDVERRTKDVIARVLKVDRSKVADGAHLVKDLGMVSIQSVEMLAAIEEEFDVEIDPDDATQNTTVKKVVDFMKKVVS